MFGACGGPPGGRGRGRFMGGFFRHLPWFGGGHDLLDGIELNDEQIERIADLKHRSFSKMGHGKVDMMDLMQALFKEMGNANIDKNKVEELRGRLKEHKAAMTDLMIDNMLAFAEILTPEQRKKIRIKKIRQFLGSDDEHHHHHHYPEHEHEHGHHGPPPPPPPPPPPRR